MNIGIDTGKNKLHIAIATDDQAPASYQVAELDLTEPTWHSTIAQLVTASHRTTIAIEPTGIHYALPVIRLATKLGATIHMVNHDITKHIRVSNISNNKSDDLDARTLAYIAQLIASNNTPLGTRQYKPDQAELTMSYRLILSARRRIVKTSVRLQNQIEQILYGIDPALAEKKATLIHAINHLQTADLDQLTELSKTPKVMNPKARATLAKALANLAPSATIQPHTSKTLTYLINELKRAHEADQEIEAQLTELNNMPETFAVSERWRQVANNSETRIAILHASTNCQTLELTRTEFDASTGNAPRRYESGNTIETRKNTGYRDAKPMLHLWTVQLLGHNNVIKTYYDQLKARNHSYPLQATRAKLSAVLYGIAHSDPTAPIRGGLQKNNEETRTKKRTLDQQSEQP